MNQNGANTISLTVYQEADETYGLDYAGSFTTIPEPGTIVLLICGGVALLALKTQGRSESGRYGGIRIEYRGRALGWKQIAAPLKPPPRAEAVGARVAVAIAKRKWTPLANHPWHEPARPEVQKQGSKLAASAPRPSLAWPSASP